MIAGTIHLYGKRGRCRVEPGTVLNARTISHTPRFTAMTWTIEFRQLGGRWSDFCVVFPSHGHWRKANSVRERLGN